MRDLHDRRAGGVELAEQLHDVFPLTRMKIPGRLVREQQRRPVNHRARDRHELLLAAGQLTGIEILLRHHAETIERVGHRGLAIIGLHVAVRQRHREILGDGEVVDEVILLEHEPHVLFAQGDAVLVLQFVDVVLEQAILSRPVAVEHSQHREQRGLPRPRRSHDRHEIALRDVERDPAQHELSPIAFGERLLDVANRKKGVSIHFSTRPSDRRVPRGGQGDSSRQTSQRTSRLRWRGT